MNKKIIPAEASFFVPVEKVLFDHSRMRRSLETAAVGTKAPKRNLPFQSKPVCALCKLAGFADRAVFVDSAQTQTRDAFGSPYLGNLENDVGFGYCGKIYDIGTGLYDYGFRDYSPVSARFTTVDPIRDGANWFSYVLNDPVNYYDLFGLEQKKGSQKVIIDPPNNVYNFYDPYKGKTNSLSQQEQDAMQKNDSQKKYNEKDTKVYIIRNHDGIGNSFDSTRYIYKDGRLVYQDVIGANAYKEDLTKVNADSTTPDGLYYYANTGTVNVPLYRNSDGTTDSNSYNNILSLRTNDMNLSKQERDAVNYGDRHSHPNQKDGGQIYSKENPFSLGCAIGQDGQVHQDEMMDVLMDGVYDPRKIEVRFVSLSNMNVTQSSNVVFNNVNYNSSGNAYIGFTNFLGGCTK